MSNTMKVFIIVVLLIVFLKHPALLNEVINGLLSVFNSLGNGNGH